MLPAPMIAVVMSGPSVGSAEAGGPRPCKAVSLKSWEFRQDRSAASATPASAASTAPDGLNYAQVVAARQGFGPVLSETPRPHRLTVTQTCAPLARRPTSRPLPQAEPPHGQPPAISSHRA